MKIQDILELMVRYDTRELSWEGKCHDCGTDVMFLAMASDEGEKVRLEMSGGAIYCPEGKGDPERGDKVYLKCPSCHMQYPLLTKWRETEMYTRVVGYLRPVKSCHAAKQAEIRDRTKFKIDLEYENEQG